MTTDQEVSVLFATPGNIGEGFYWVAAVVGIIAGIRDARRRRWM